MLDDIAAFNKDRWEELSREGVQFGIPWLDLAPAEALRRIDPEGVPMDAKGWDVLCLAASGGQQSAAFGLLGARVTVFDISETQLEKDRLAAAHYRLELRTVQGDMRDLSCFAPDSFDVVWQPYSLNYSPVVEPVFREVARVLRPDGIYEVTFANPFTQALDDDSWDGEGYRLRGPYTDGEDVRRYSPIWEVEQSDGSVIAVDRPHEFRHNLSTVLNALVQNGFVLLHLQEWSRQADPLEPGSWPHFTQFAPPWFDSWWRLSEAQ